MNPTSQSWTTLTLPVPSLIMILSMTSMRVDKSFVARLGSYRVNFQSVSINTALSLSKHPDVRNLVVHSIQPFSDPSSSSSDNGGVVCVCGTTARGLYIDSDSSPAAHGLCDHQRRNVNQYPALQRGTLINAARV